jgi:hypothetical protein
METTKPGQNGGAERRAAQPLGNLSYQQGLILNHTGLDGLPGYKVAIFEKLNHGGSGFQRLIEPGQPFSKSRLSAFFASPQKYFAVAVNESVLKYSFDQPVILDDDVRQFQLTFHLTYRAANARLVAEMSGQDPLRRLCEKMAGAISRSCAQRKWQMIKERFRELEQIVLNSERRGLRDYAATLGIDIISIELDRHLPETAKQLDFDRIKADEDLEKFRINQRVDGNKGTVLRAKDHQLKKEDIDHEYDLKEKRLDNEIGIQDKVNRLDQFEQNRNLRTVTNQAIGKAITQVGEEIRTPADLLEAFTAGQDITRVLQAGGGFGVSGTGAIGSGASAGLLGTGEDMAAALVTEAFTQIAKSSFTTAQKRLLRSNILHLIAEAMLDDLADEELLKKYADQLSELARTLQMTKAQSSLIYSLRNYEQLRAKLR